jgi:hypothetical protein
MTTIRVVLDGCVLLPQVLNNLLLTLADAELFRPVWTPDLLDEVERDLAGERFGKSQEQAARRVRQMRRGAGGPRPVRRRSGFGSGVRADTRADRPEYASAAHGGGVARVTRPADPTVRRRGPGIAGRPGRRLGPRCGACGVRPSGADRRADRLVAAPRSGRRTAASCDGSGRTGAGARAHRSGECGVGVPDAGVWTGICRRYGRVWIRTSGRCSRRSGCATTTIR